MSTRYLLDINRFDALPSCHQGVANSHLVVLFVHLGGQQGAYEDNGADGALPCDTWPILLQLALLQGSEACTAPSTLLQKA
jgi:hypothetical protein